MADQALSAAQPLRSWRLSRRPALAPRQFLACLAALLAFLAFLAALACVAGYWPIAVFFAVDALAATGAFLHAGRHALDGERLELHASGELEIHVTHGAEERSYRLPAAWLCIEHERCAPTGQPQLRLAWGRCGVPVGDQVAPASRHCFECELRSALNALRTWNAAEPPPERDTAAQKIPNRF